MWCVECGIILLISAIIAGGTLGALVRGWGLVARILRLERDFLDMDGTLKREVKIRANEAKLSRADKVARELQELETLPVRPRDPWEY